MWGFRGLSGLFRGSGLRVFGRSLGEVYPDNHMTAWIQRMLRNVTVPLFLKISKDMKLASDLP